MILEDWINLIPNKLSLSIKINKNLNEFYNKLNYQYIIIFDVEFLKFKINSKQIQTIHEMGGIILVKENNNWYLKYIFHLNMPLLQNDLNNLYLLTSTYNTLTDENTKKVKELENELLIHPKLIDKQNLSNESTIQIIKKNKLSKIYLNNKKIKKLLQTKKKNYDKFIKELGRIKHLVYGNDLINFKKEHKLFLEIINIILNDSTAMNRTIQKPYEFIKLTNELFSKSFLIIKGIEDIKALKNHSILLNLKPQTNLKYFDISKFNNTLFTKCNSAELEKTFICLEKMNLTQTYNEYYEIVKTFTKEKAHNPLVDSYYTWIIYNIFLENKIL